MSEFLEIVGGTTLRGTVRAGGAKNAGLPLLIATLLTSEECTLTNVPNLTDTSLVIHLLEQFGAEVQYDGDEVKVRTPRLLASEASYSLVKALRASFWVLAPLLARGGAARVALPGGDLIGARPVDLHLEGLSKMGAEISLKHGVVHARADKGLRPAQIDLSFPSVGATHQLVMAASLTPGKTVITGCACEPEIVALAQFLNDMGADIQGAGESVIEIRGESQLRGAKTHLIGDRIEAGTYLLAGVITGGEVTVEGVDPTSFGVFLDILREMGVSVSTTESAVSVRCCSGPIKGVRVKTGPFPGLATDLQAPLMAALTIAEGTSSIEETIYEGRFGHASELARMGAHVKVSDRIVTIEGVKKLTGAPVDGLDIRAAASLVLAALAAEGRTELHEVHHLRRGYEHVEKKFGALGARMWSRISDPDDFIFAGC
jgi:UDP-N-acetylglucosamine 1-carboxyvinyltransferase